MNHYRRRLTFTSVSLLLALVVFQNGLFAAELGTGGSKFESEIKAFEAADKTNPPPAGAILFVGSSSIRLWKDLGKDFPDFKTIQRGFGGSQISDVTALAHRIVIPYQPKQVVLYSGDNDIAGGKSPEQILSDCKELVATIQKNIPETQITFISIKPSPSRWHLAEQARKANALVKAFTAGNSRLDFIDVFTPMLGADGKPRPELFLADNLHMNRKGYDLWVMLIKLHLNSVAKIAGKRE